MKRFKLGFGNKTILEQIAVCRRVATGIAKLPAAHRKYIAANLVTDSVAEAVAAHAEVESLKTALKAALARRADKVSAMRERTTAAATGLMIAHRGRTGGAAGGGLGGGEGQTAGGCAGARPLGCASSPRITKAGCGCTGNGPSAVASSLSRRPPTARLGLAGNRRPSASNKPAM
ncbi:MAG TPA: hypothetical protein VMD27_03280 [Candidatus Aquilonibacter sp.]|nr:hypothetical protein [Candidatus Aquilonibacter sp.]